MSALLIGFLLVVASAGIFGFALFGRRPVPQPAIVGGALRRGPYPGAEERPSEHVGQRAGVPDGTTVGTATPLVHLSAADVRPSGARRIRAVVLLALSMVGSAVLIGALLSLVAVGAVILIS